MNQKLTDKAIKTREKIIKTARSLFITKGYESTTLRGIAKESGLTTGALYKYFSSKSELFIIIFSNGFIEQWEKFMDYDENITPEEYINLNADINGGIAKTFGVELLRVYFTEQMKLTKVTELWRDLGGDRYLDHDGVLIKAITKNYADKLSVEEIDELILRLDRGIFVDWIIRNGEFDVKEATREIMLIAFKEVFPKYNW